MKTYNLFISHSWRYEDAYKRLVELLNSYPGFSYKNYSVSSEVPIVTENGTNKELYGELKNKIRNVSVVVVLAGVYASYSDWINNEIKIAKKEFAFPKPILAIKPWASCKISQLAENNADLIVNWNTKSIVEAIKKLSEEN
ncbi:TIR domain-containing protein [Campylobacter jejuni]|uniref:TIR domain-containing protein n=1 Tax=Campylobacter jejuni TaxID=197 RepID=UPI0011A51129|nr:TIR domain-containing protein [Campylobacter jejuni]